MKKLIRGIFFDVDRLGQRENKKIEKIKENPEKAQNFKRYGITSIVLLVIGIILSLLEFLIILYVVWPIIKYAFSVNLAIIGNFFVIVLALMVYLIPIYIIAYSRKYVAFDKDQIFTREVNDKKIGIIMRIITLIGVFICIFSLILSTAMTLPYLLSNAN